MLNRRSFLAGLLATATAPVVPPIPGPRGTSYIVFEDIPLEKLAMMEAVKGEPMIHFWQPFISCAEIEQIKAIWLDRTRVYSPA